MSFVLSLMMIVLGGGNHDDNRTVDFREWMESSGPEFLSRMGVGSGRAIAPPWDTGKSAATGSYGKRTGTPGSSTSEIRGNSAFSTVATTRAVFVPTISGWEREATTTGIASARAERSRSPEGSFRQGTTHSGHIASMVTSSTMPTATATRGVAASVGSVAAPPTSGSVHVRGDNKDRNENGDCRNTRAECSDDDQLAVIVCVEPDSCRF